MQQTVVDAIKELIADDYACTRVWEAWQVGTMTQEDFMALSETERAEEIYGLIEEHILFDLNEIDNKPWRVFRQLAKLAPDCETDYTRYARFYEAGGSKVVESMIALWENTGEMPE